MRTIGKELGFALSGIFCWLRENKQFSEQYAQAKQEQAEALVEEMHEISDEPPSVITDDKGVTRYDSAGVQWQRLRVDTRKWIASKLKPKKYGERLGLDNAEDNKPFNIVIKKLNE